MNHIKNNKGVYILIGLNLLLVVFMVFSQPRLIVAGAGEVTAGDPYVNQIVVGKQSNVLIFSGAAATNTPKQCSGRLIGTPGIAILLKFASTSEAAAGREASTTPVLSGILGIPQAASTSVYYDAKQYGCGYVGARGLEASTTIMVVEFP